MNATQFFSFDSFAPSNAVAADQAANVQAPLCEIQELTIDQAMLVGGGSGCDTTGG